MKTLTERNAECDIAFQEWWKINILKVKKSTQHFPMKQFRMAWNYSWEAGYQQALIDVKEVSEVLGQ